MVRYQHAAAVAVCRAIIIGISIARASYGDGASVTRESVESHRLDGSGFVIVSDRNQARKLLERARRCQVSMLERLRTCEGEGQIEQWSFKPALVGRFKVHEASALDGGMPSVVEPDGDGASLTPTRIAGPFKARRTTKTKFVWSSDERSLRSTYERTLPTIFEAVDDNRRFSVVGELIIRNLVRPDGFYCFRPYTVAGEFDGYPRSLAGGPPTRVVERLPVERASELSEFSTVFDPSAMLLVGGCRIDALSEEYIDRVVEQPDGVSVKERSDGSILVTTRYVNSNAPDGPARLVVDVLLDATLDFFPTKSSFTNAAGLPREALSWSYQRQQSVRFPIAFTRDRFDAEGRPSMGRAVRLSRLVINGPVEESDFSLASIGVEDGDRIIDRLEKSVAFIKGGEPVPVGSAAMKPMHWLILLNVLALAGVIVMVALRLRQKRRTGGDTAS